MKQNVQNSDNNIEFISILEGLVSNSKIIFKIR